MNDKPSLASIAKQLKKKFGDDAVMTMADNPQEVEAFSTGSLLLDKITGIGGVPRGRITEIFGGESSGKTTIALQTIANAQKQGVNCFYADVEQALDLKYAKSLGVREDLFMFSQPSCGEDALQIIHDVIQTGEVGLVVVDSVAALSPRAELEGEMSDATVGSLARLMGRALRMLTPAVAHTNTALVFINQERSTIGQTYGNPLTTSGGKALKYAASLRVGMNQSKKIGKQYEETGHIVIARIPKNKLAPPFRRCEFVINFGKGVSLIDEMISIGTHAGVWNRKGSWYYVGEESFQGSDKLAQYLKETREQTPELFEHYLSRCKNFILEASADSLGLSDEPEE